MTAAFGKRRRSGRGPAGQGGSKTAPPGRKPRQHHVPAVLKVQDLQSIKWLQSHLKTLSRREIFGITCLVCLMTSEQVNLQNLSVVCSRKSY
jgi:hypothetical protein